MDINLNLPTLPTSDQKNALNGANAPSTSNVFATINDLPNFTSTLKHTVKAGLAISKGQAVYVSSASGTNMIVSKASNTSEATSSKTMGLLAQDLAINGQGYVITEGLLDGLNTFTATIGDPVWLGTSGNLIYGLASKPYAPAHLVYIGIVTRVSATVGEIFVKIQNGFELKEIHDVDLISSAPVNNDLLAYDNATSLWNNKSASTLGIAPKASPTFTGTVTTPAIIVSSETASRVAIIDASKNVKSADTTTYPSLTEFSYVKGATSNIQTQINAISTPPAFKIFLYNNFS